MACAGLTAADHPRIRGEHAGEFAGGVRTLGSSPHTRGAPEKRQRPRLLLRIIPAYAGSTTSNPRCSSSKPDHPRIRGEHDTRLLALLFCVGSSPHTRGAPFMPSWRLGDFGIIPAYAGSTGRRRSCESRRRDHPRIRGEHVVPVAVFAEYRGSSPHTRGALWGISSGSPQTGIIPAYAGSTLGPPLPGLENRGSSPHTRGAPPHQERPSRWGGIIPAYAGSTPRPMGLTISRWDHPRIRGEHQPALVGEVQQQGSSPHTRGALYQPVHGVNLKRIIPAYAGSTSTGSSSSARRADHPRIRGEHLDHRHPPGAGAGSSPHTRGALSRSSRSRTGGGIIPAYAGSTAPRKGASGWQRDHPRIRGEHRRILPIAAEK